VKRSGRDEPKWVTIHKYMEATLVISLYSYLYLELAKMLSFLLFLIFSLKQNQRQRAEPVLGKREGGQEEGEVAQTMYTHVSKCKNHKINKKQTKKE
jgi:hypothetical protein